MIGTEQPPGPGDIETLVLRALVRKLIAKQLLSEADVRALLLDAAENLDVAGGRLTPEAARDIVEEDLAPAYLG